MPEEFRYIFTKNLFFLIPRKYHRVRLCIFSKKGGNSEKGGCINFYASTLIYLFREAV